NEIAAYLSYDVPHEGAYVPMALQMYMADYKICDSDPIQPDYVGCYTRFVFNGLATQATYSLLKYRLYPTCFPPGYTYWNHWPSFWNDCHDLGGCTLPDDGFGEMNHCGDTDGGIMHGSFTTEFREAAWFNAQYGAWFTDIPRYAISNSSVFD